MNIFESYLGALGTIISDLGAADKLPRDLNLKNVTIEPPRDASHGDISTNVAMVLTKQARMKPRDIAELVAEGLNALEDVEKVDVAGPGFINITLKPHVIQQQVSTILKAAGSYGRSALGKRERVNVEYVSVNPTGPLHVGHCRGAIFGDALASLLDFTGYDVSREYYINDAGGQIDVLARSAYVRYQEALGIEIEEIPEGLYPGAYLIPVGQALAKEFGDKWRDAPESEWLGDIRTFATNAMMDLIRADLDTLGIRHDVFFSELTLHNENRIQPALDQLEEKGLIYTGVLEAPKGTKPDDWEERPQTLFKATEFGDDVDRAVMKSDGSWTYFAADVAYHYDKIQRGFTTLIDVWGADHGGYVKRVESVIKALGGDKIDFDVRLCQMVKLLRGGEPVKMSKRSGNFITMRDIVEEVGKDVVRFIMLTRKNDASLEFDFTKVTEQSKDNPVFYVQYAHARVHSVLRKAQTAFPDLDISREALARADMSVFTDPSEQTLIKNMLNWPRLVESAALAREPHRIAYYLYELASEFHALWNKGNDNVDLRFIIEDDTQKTVSRLALISAVASLIATGLDILGVEPVEEM
ncbi:arginine--tRNA ligase [Paremcibacter congregatus]|uniref:Arginine--tRNA ligase n=1 Tax=Paremcibacter congregatus TaxID=2043170 RepID=A0A2G4YN21_9PROT|nr:arginine--tRNA ligase [Paremcibacter congregatus]PHZ83695.1 arginine--tRNA ligase [Paremcibacter congregatus]QDE27398.1 arginine--tRNA ligase [Paremcibacter congregatus]